MGKKHSKSGSTRNHESKEETSLKYVEKVRTQNPNMKNPNPNPNPKTPQYRPKHIYSYMEEFYKRYKSPNEDMIMAEGIERLCINLNVEPQDIVMLVLSWHMKAATMGEFSKEEFFNGLKELKVDSLEKLSGALPRMREELKEDGKLKEVYEFAFRWGREKGQKSLQRETAIGLWQLLFAEMETKWVWVDKWCEFLEEKHNFVITEDTWNLLLVFIRKVDASMSNVNSEELFWPSLFDEFVEYLEEKGLVTLVQTSQQMVVDDS